MEFCNNIIPSKIALLIDAENTKPDLKELLHLCKNYGQIEISRIYAKRNLLKKDSWQKETHLLNITPVYAETGIKNGADMLIIIDAVDLLYNRPDISTYIIVSIDYDFVPLIHRLMKAGKKVVGVSTYYPPKMFRNCFNHFHTILRPEWDIFEFCLHEFYISYLDCKKYEGWALVDDIILSMPYLEQFAQRLIKIGYTNYVSFLKDSHWFNVRRDSIKVNNKSLTCYWVIKKSSSREPSLELIETMQQYAHQYFSDKPYFSGSLMSLSSYFKKSPRKTF